LVPHLEAASLLAFHPFRFDIDSGKRCHGRLSVWQQSKAMGRKGYRSSRSHEQGCAKFPFQLANRLGESGLSQEEAFSRPAEVKLLGECDECSQVSQLKLESHGGR
jgi:hypothetical protein